MKSDQKPKGHGPSDSYPAMEMWRCAVNVGNRLRVGDPHENRRLVPFIRSTRNGGTATLAALRRNCGASEKRLPFAMWSNITFQALALPERMPTPLRGSFFAQFQCSKSRSKTTLGDWVEANTDRQIILHNAPEGPNNYVTTNSFNRRS